MRISRGLIMIVLALLAGVISARVFSARTPPNVFAQKPLVMKLRRACVNCPNYTITLTADGNVLYEGGDFAAVDGICRASLDSAAVNDLMLDFVQPEFLELEGTYPTQGIKRMSMSLSIEMAGLSKAVLSEDGYGPTLLLTLARKMDDLPHMRACSGWPH